MKLQTRKTTLSSLLAGLILGAGSAAYGNGVDPNLIAYDGMDYPLMIDFEIVPGFVIQIPNTLEGNNGGYGWAGAWTFVETIQGKGSPATNTSLIFDPANPGEDEDFVYTGPLQ
ncbi:MAG TPA: hypothetical protein VK995_01750, partial [Oceanipulchritudo sp.]|nr:hypothetical protein [Oceanipulchritudo sp.]